MRVRTLERWACCETRMNLKGQFIKSQHKLLPTRQWHHGRDSAVYFSFPGHAALGHAGPSLFVCTAQPVRKELSQFLRTRKASSEMVWFLDDTEDIEDDKLLFPHMQLRWKNLMYLTQAKASTRRPLSSLEA